MMRLGTTRWPFCWHCSKQLMRKKSGGFYFAVVCDPLGVNHQVHKQCVGPVIGDGIHVVCVDECQPEIAVQTANR